MHQTQIQLGVPRKLQVSQGLEVRFVMTSFGPACGSSEASTPHGPMGANPLRRQPVERAAGKERRKEGKRIGRRTRSSRCSAKQRGYPARVRETRGTLLLDNGGGM